VYPYLLNVKKKVSSQQLYGLEVTKEMFLHVSHFKFHGIFFSIMNSSFFILKKFYSY